MSPENASPNTGTRTSEHVDALLVGPNVSNWYAADEIDALGACAHLFPDRDGAVFIGRRIRRELPKGVTPDCTVELYRKTTETARHSQPMQASHAPGSGMATELRAAAAEQAKAVEASGARRAAEPQGTLGLTFGITGGEGGVQ